MQNNLHYFSVYVSEHWRQTYTVTLQHKWLTTELNAGSRDLWAVNGDVSPHRYRYASGKHIRTRPSRRCWRYHITLSDDGLIIAGICIPVWIFYEVITAGWYSLLCHSTSCERAFLGHLRSLWKCEGASGILAKKNESYSTASGCGELAKRMW